MGYYSQTTKKLMDQIGEPYESRAKGSMGPDLASIIMALMFMPQDGKLPTGPVVDPLKDSQAILSERAYNQAVPRDMSPIPETQIVRGTSMPSDSIFKRIFNPGAMPPVATAPAAATAGSPLAKVMASLGADQGLLTLGKTGPSILGNNDMVLQVLRLLGINV